MRIPMNITTAGIRPISNRIPNNAESGCVAALAWNPVSEENKEFLKFEIL